MFLLDRWCSPQQQCDFSRANTYYSKTFLLTSESLSETPACQDLLIGPWVLSLPILAEQHDFQLLGKSPKRGLPRTGHVKVRLIGPNTVFEILIPSTSFLWSWFGNECSKGLSLCFKLPIDIVLNLIEVSFRWQVYQAIQVRLQLINSLVRVALCCTLTYQIVSKFSLSLATTLVSYFICALMSSRSVENCSWIFFISSVKSFLTFLTSRRADE